MNDSSNNNVNKFQMEPGTILTPVAVLVSGSDIISLIVKVSKEGQTYYTVLVGPSREPTGWIKDDLLVAAAVAKHKFTRLSTEEGVPTLSWVNVVEDVYKLEKWLKEHDN